MTTKISGTGFNSLTVDELILTTPLAEQYGGSGSTGVYKMEYASPKSATGTFVDFTDIPSWAKRITVMFDGVSTNGASPLIMQLGISGSIETTGYSSHAAATQASAVGSGNYTAGFGISNDNVATYSHDGNFYFTNLSSNIFTMTGNCKNTDARVSMCSGKKTLSGKLTQIRITTVNGTDLFDAGTINVMWEGFV